LDSNGTIGWQATGANHSWKTYFTEKLQSKILLKSIFDQ